tara:strand:+ start:1735 stop:2166 length:432 start_codon:yes stop_codon:yes gene_type:complete
MNLSGFAHDLNFSFQPLVSEHRIEFMEMVGMPVCVHLSNKCDSVLVSTVLNEKNNAPIHLVDSFCKGLKAPVKQINFCYRIGIKDYLLKEEFSNSHQLISRYQGIVEQVQHLDQNLEREIYRVFFKKLNQLYENEKVLSEQDR